MASVWERPAFPSIGDIRAEYRFYIAALRDGDQGWPGCCHAGTSRHLWPLRRCRQELSLAPSGVTSVTVPVACAAGHQAWKARFCRASLRVSLFGISVGTAEIRGAFNLAGAAQGPRHH